MSIPALTIAQASLGRSANGRDAFRRVSNPRLRWTRFFPDHDDDDAKREFLCSFEEGGEGGFSAGTLGPYARFYARWRALLENRGASVFDWKACSRVAFGIGDESVVEVGIRLHDVYGVPMIAGSAVKGVCARYARDVFGLEDAEHHEVFGVGGKSGKAGLIIFNDVLWKPEGGPFAVDAIAVHHPGYYQGGGEPPTDWDSPIPISYLTAKGTFTFALEGLGDAVSFCRRVLAHALADWGIGGRTRKGYGRFETGVRPQFQVRRLSAIGAEAEPETELASAPTAKPASATTRPGIEILEHVEILDVSLEPGPGELVMRVPLPDGRILPARIKVDRPGLFQSDADRERLRSRLKKKSTVACRVEFLVEGNLVTVRQILPESPP